MTTTSATYRRYEGRLDAPSSPRSHLDLHTVGLFYLGLSTALPSFIDRPTEGVSFTLLVAVALAWAGWKQHASSGVIKTYRGSALAVSMLASLSALSAWNFNSMYKTLGFAIWLVFIVAGLAGLLREEFNRRALVLGLALGAAVYGVVVAIRLNSGVPILDRSSQSELEKTIVGFNRNALNILIVLLLPFLIDGIRSRRLSPFRWALLVLICLPLAFSGGRAGLVSAGFVVLLDAILKPTLGRKVRAVLLAVAVILGGAIFLHGSAGVAGLGASRLEGFVVGKRTSSDRAREVLVRKAWTVAKENPVFGVGYGGFRGLHHSVTEEAPTPRAQHIVDRGVAHNTYVESLAELGFVGGGSLFVLLGIVMWSGLRRSRLREVRAPTVAFAGILVMITFNSALAAMLYLPMALVLGAVIGAGSSAEHPGQRGSGFRLLLARPNI